MRVRYVFWLARAVGRRRYYVAGIFVFVCTALFFSGNQGFVLCRNTYESLMYLSFPSPERAFAYGEKHFSADNVLYYDIDRAEDFFKLAVASNPDLPYVYHELARIHFLRGDFVRALVLINTQIALHGDKTPNSYYIRGLIEGYMGEYDAAAKDYAHYLKSDPHNWAAVNDYAWVLLKAKRHAEAAAVTDEALMRYPDNPWLLNSNAIAYFELGEYDRALVSAQKAAERVVLVSEREWLTAYPGNDPRIAKQGLDTFKNAVAANVHSIELGRASGAVQSTVQP